METQRRWKHYEELFSLEFINFLTRNSISLEIETLIITRDGSTGIRFLDAELFPMRIPPRASLRLRRYCWVTFRMTAFFEPHRIVKFPAKANCPRLVCVGELCFFSSRFLLFNELMNGLSRVVQHWCIDIRSFRTSHAMKAYGAEENMSFAVLSKARCLCGYRSLTRVSRSYWLTQSHEFNMPSTPHVDIGAVLSSTLLKDDAECRLWKSLPNLLRLPTEASDCFRSSTNE